MRPEQTMSASSDTRRFQPVDAEELPEYPFSYADRLDSHFYMPWQRRRWLNSDMRLKGTPECRALYFDLINVAYDQSPIGTLPVDLDILAKISFVQSDHFRALCRLEYGPLHRWHRCRCDGGEIRLMHPFVTSCLLEATARREDNRARVEAANVRKRLQRLRITVAEYHKELASNDAAIRWIDEWLTERDCRYRGGSWIEQAIQAWADHSLRMGLARREGRS